MPQPDRAPCGLGWPAFWMPPPIAIRSDLPPATVDASSTAARARRVAGRAMLLLVVVALGGALVVQTRRLERERAADTARTGAATAARLAAVALATYDYRHLNHDFAVTESVLAPGFLANFAATSASATPTLLQDQSTSAARVLHVAVESASGTTATVLVFMDQTLTTLVPASQRTEQERAVVSLVRAAGRWKVSDFELDAAAPNR